MSESFPKPAEFLLERPLYSEEQYSEESTWDALGLLYFAGTYDAYCTHCNREATFQAQSPNRPKDLIRDHALEEMQKKHGFKPKAPQIPHGIYQIRGICTRQNSHTQDFFFLVGVRFNKQEEGSTGRFVKNVQKVGQQPSFGDLHLQHVKRYRESLPAAQLGELTRAISLASHDVGIGAYVYLRRVFEWLVEEAHQVGAAESTWDEATYVRSRMSEKISLLREHLPEFISQHPEMYGLLSKGVHELTEAECISNFPTLRLATELILDERLERKQREKKIAEAKAALARAAARNA